MTFFTHSNSTHTQTAPTLKQHPHSNSTHTQTAPTLKQHPHSHSHSLQSSSTGNASLTLGGMHVAAGFQFNIKNLAAGFFASLDIEDVSKGKGEQQTNKPNKQTKQTNQTNKPNKQTKQTNQTNKPNKQTKQTNQTNKQTSLLVGLANLIANGITLFQQYLNGAFNSAQSAFGVAQAKLAEGQTRVAQAQYNVDHGLDSALDAIASAQGK